MIGKLLSTYRAKLQAVFLTLGLAAIGLTKWETSAGATAALRQATSDRLAAIRQARVRQIERYFADFGNHVLTLSTDDSTIPAIQEPARLIGGVFSVHTAPGKGTTIEVKVPRE